MVDRTAKQQQPQQTAAHGAPRKSVPCVVLSNHTCSQATFGGFCDAHTLAKGDAMADWVQLAGNELLLGLVVAGLIVVIARRWQQQNKAGHLNQSHGGLLRMARESSAASLATLKQVSSSASFARLSEAVRNLKCFNRGCFVPIISSSELFVPPMTVKKMSLEEMSTVIKYAMECNRSDFDEALFLASVSPHVKQVIAAMDTSVIKSRGVNVQPYRTTSQSLLAGNIDALYFCAAMRLFVEWRAVKIIPEEYKAYAVGMNVAKRDLVQNTAKVEEAIQKWIDNEMESGKAKVVAPTVRQILEYELVHNVHTHLPKLKDNTAAIGIVWMTRQLVFQTEIFANVIQVPTTYRTGIEAVRTAYKTAFDKYHGWAIQQVFNYAFNGAPDVSVVFRMMNPDIAQDIDSYFPDVDTVVIDYPTPDVVQSSFTSSLDESNHGSDDDDLASTCVSYRQEGRNPMAAFGHDVRKIWDELATNVERGWTAFVEDIIQGGRKGKRTRVHSVDTTVTGASLSFSQGVKSAPQQLHRPSVPKYVLDEQALQLYIERETTKAAHKHIDSYLTTMIPLLKEMNSTINEFGMNDPSRV